jgi:predicted nuclease of predicted toxin-antitoxin system
MSDEIQLQFSLSNGRVIFTQDTDFLRINQLARCFKSEKFPSILTFRQRQRTVQ